MSNHHDEDEDEAMKAAIAGSLETFSESPSALPRLHTSNLVDLTEDSDDGKNASSAIDDPELQRAIKLSLQEQASAMGLPPEKDDPTPPNQHPPEPKDSTTTSGIPGIDRKKQEQERLARLAKKRGAENISPPPAAKKTKMVGSETVDLTSKPSNRAAQPAAPCNRPAQALEYPDGAVKKTWAFGHTRRDDIKIEEVIQKSDLELAVLSAFQWDYDWLFTKFNTKETRFLLVMGAKDENIKRQLHEDFDGIPNVRLCLPPMGPQVNCMHSKLMLLFHPDHLRIVVPTANLVPYDWGEQGGIMENVVFLIDLPRKSSSATEDTPTHFLQELRYFMKASAFHDKIIDKLSEFDFSKTADIAFVHTIGGSHSGDSWQRTGHCGLGGAVGHLGLRTSQPLNLDYVTSSVGALKDQFMRSIYLAAQGDSGLRELTLRTAKTFPSDKWGVTVKGTDGKDWKDRFIAYFPSLKTVASSKAGKQGAGTICFQSKWYTASSFPSHLMRDNISLREGMLMHNKMLFVRPESGIIRTHDQKTVCRGWAYVGSANLSESAWGRLVLDRATQQPKLNCRNWECGVVIPIWSPIKETQQGDLDISNEKMDGRKDMTEIFSGHVPVPMQVPGPSYESKQTRPWYYMED